MTVRALCISTAGKANAPGLGLIMHRSCTAGDQVLGLEGLWGKGGHLTPELNQLSLLTVKALAMTMLQ